MHVSAHSQSRASSPGHLIPFPFLFFLWWHLLVGPTSQSGHHLWTPDATFLGIPRVRWGLLLPRVGTRKRRIRGIRWIWQKFRDPVGLREYLQERRPHPRRRNWVISCLIIDHHAKQRNRMPSGRERTSEEVVVPPQATFGSEPWPSPRLGLWGLRRIPRRVVIPSPWESGAECVGVARYAACPPDVVVSSVAVIVLGRMREAAFSIIAGTYSTTWSEAIGTSAGVWWTPTMARRRRPQRMSAAPPWPAAGWTMKHGPPKRISAGVIRLTRHVRLGDRCSLDRENVDRIRSRFIKTTTVNLRSDGLFVEQIWAVALWSRCLGCEVPLRLRHVSNRPPVFFKRTHRPPAGQSESREFL
jgi:hypothetical protein